jgi:hypothetical protein
MYICIYIYTYMYTYIYTYTYTREEKQHIAEQIIEPVKTRISVSRVGTNWKTMMKKDTVGCMIGFYIFIRRSKEYKDIPVLSVNEYIYIYIYIYLNKYMYKCKYI